MLQDQPITELITRLEKTRTFEKAATETLGAMLTCTKAALAGSEYASRARLLRSIVHIRAEGSYQHLFGIDHAAGEPIEGIGYLTSANVWRWVEAHGCSVSIDIQLGIIKVWLAKHSLRHAETDASDTSGAPGDESRVRMLNRDSTHVHVVPLRAPGSAVHGMIAIEVKCKAAMGREFIWGTCHEQLELLASMAAPYLRALPSKRPPRNPAKGKGDPLLPVVGNSTAGLVKLLKVFAGQRETILISGPTGSGKSRIARWCHAQSPRQDQRFETLDLLSVPEQLQMAELFGWKRGAFTGAVKSNPGALARAAGGTLFIDEIDKLSLKAQAGLLRVLEEQSYRPLGDDGETQRADVRFLIGTNADLRAAVREGHFREDLYYRIHVLPVRLPALIERLDELPQWANYMLQRRHEAYSQRGGVRLTKDALKLLLDQPWPGNLRQLDNLIRRAYIFALADHSTASGVLVLGPEHVTRALSFESHDHHGSSNGAPVALLWQAARAYVRSAEHQNGSSELSLDLSAGFRGLVIEAAVQRLGSRERAFRLLGEQRLLNNRNHHRVYRREMARARKLLEAMGGPGAADLMSVDC